MSEAVDPSDASFCRSFRRPNTRADAKIKAPASPTATAAPAPKAGDPDVESVVGLTVGLEGSTIAPVAVGEAVGASVGLAVTKLLSKNCEPIGTIRPRGSTL